MKLKFTTTRRLRTIAVSSVILITGMSTPLMGQGDLTPPPFGSLPAGDEALDAGGAPTPNMKSLTQTDPGQPLPSKDVDFPGLNGSLGAFTISAPGNYYLTENIIDKPIMIVSPNVTLDLRGYTMIDSAGAGASAISIAPGIERVHVRNGHITGPWDTGVSLGDYSSVRDLNVDGTMSFSIEVGGQSTVHSCIVRGMDLQGESGPMPHAGISAGAGSVVSHSTAREIWGDGIRVDRSSRVVDCVSTCNLGSGFTATETTTFTGCASFMNLRNGYQTGPAASMSHCTAHENFEAGFLNRTGSVLSNCTSRQNHTEGYVAMPDVPSNITNYDGANLSDNATSYLHCSASLNASDGFLSTINSTYTHCTAVSNGTMLFEATPPYSPSPGDGFDVVDSCRVVNCMASKNTAHGIRAVLDNYLEQNTCHTNGLAGIDLVGPGNTVIKNYVKFNIGGGILVGGLPLPAAGAGGVAPLIVPSGAGPWNPFGNFFL